jgi:hypothetical protein
MTPRKDRSLLWRALWHPPPHAALSARLGPWGAEREKKRAVGDYLAKMRIGTRPDAALFGEWGCLTWNSTIRSFRGVAFNFNTMPYAAALASMRLFAGEVMPCFSA